MTPTSDYTVPRDGVLTSWSAQGDTSGANHELKLKVVDPEGGTTYRIVGEDPVTRPIANDVLNTFAVHIPVDEGDLLALWVGPGSHPCAWTGPGGPLTWRGGSHPEPGIGDLFTTDDSNPADRLNASAEVVTKRCKGKAPTIAGTPEGDILVGTPDKDVIVGLGGRDTIRGLGAKDRLCGNKGKDKLRGGGGNDTLKGAKGDDTLNGGSGRDRCIGGPGDDTAKKCEIEQSI